MFFVKSKYIGNNLIFLNTTNYIYQFIYFTEFSTVQFKKFLSFVLYKKLYISRFTSAVVIETAWFFQVASWIALKLFSKSSKLLLNYCWNAKLTTLTYAVQELNSVMLADFNRFNVNINFRCLCDIFTTLDLETA